MSRSYRCSEKVPPHVTRALGRYSALVRTLLYRRGIKTAAEAEAFLTPCYKEGLHEPFLMPGLADAAARIERALDAEEHIVIYSDYDCDGIPGGVALRDFFDAVGYPHVSNYIPHRHTEGFGLNTNAVAELAAAGARLIITIDCGSADHEAVAHANKCGVDVIITDHHQPPAQLPPAVSVVNPKVAGPGGGRYPFPELCGAGVVFKLIQGLIARREYALPEGREKWWLDMVGIATIADMVPLVGENRVFARFGLLVLQKSRRPGLQRLFHTRRLSQAHLTEDDVGFTIAPRINAASRMDTPEDAFHLLHTHDAADAHARVARLEKLNNERRGAVAAMSKELKRRIGQMPHLPRVIVAGSPLWRPSLVGLSAQKMVEEHARPAFVWGRDGNGTLKGSCRSDGSVSVVALMEAAGDVFLEYGGHHASGGFSVSYERVHTLSDALNAAYTSVASPRSSENEQYVVEEVLSLADADDAFAETLAPLAPFGIGNEKPLFAFLPAAPRAVEQFGRGREHLKLRFDTPRGAREAYAFFSHPGSFSHTPTPDVPLTLIGTVDSTFFMGARRTRVRITDILPAS